jgi:DNA-binding CsgD family transcriptional regulator
MNGRKEDLADIEPRDRTVAGRWGFRTAAPVLDGARVSVAWVPPTELGPEPAAADVAATVDRLAQLARRGLRVRVLCPDRVIEQREYVALLTRHPGWRAPRVSSHDWPEHLLVDEQVALLRTRSGADDEDAAVVVRARPVVRTLADVFHAAWDTAVALPELVPDEGRLGSEPAQRILDLLGAGYRDAAAANELGLSIRTYRRHVAELMNELNAASRFQAGMRAAHLGLLPRDEPPQPMGPTG